MTVPILVSLCGRHTMQGCVNAIVTCVQSWSAATCTHAHLCCCCSLLSLLSLRVCWGQAGKLVGDCAASGGCFMLALGGNGGWRHKLLATAACG